MILDCSRVSAEFCDQYQYGLEFVLVFMIVAIGVELLRKVRAR